MAAPPRQGSGLVTALLSITFTLLLTLIMPLAYLGALMNGVLVPAGAAVASNRLAVGLCSPVALGLVAAIALIALVGIFLATARRLRRAFRAIGISLITCAALTALLALGWGPISGALGSSWSSALAGTVGSYVSWAAPCACIMAALGAVCLSAFATAHVAERRRA